MPTCKNHSDREAVAQCSRCGAYLCQECIAPGGGDVLCFDCSIAVAKEAVERQETPFTGETISAPRQQRKLSGATRLIVALGAVILAVELVILLGTGSTTPHTATDAQQAVSPKKQAVAQTGADTILISQALEAYRKQHGNYPADLETIAAELPPQLQSALSDPSTFYTLHADDTYTLTFGGHGPTRLSMDSKLPVPRPVEVSP